MPVSVDGAPLSRREAMVLFRLVFSDSGLAEALALAEPWRAFAARLAAADVADRPTVWDELPTFARVQLDRALGGVAGAVPRPAPRPKPVEPASIPIPTPEPPRPAAPRPSEEGPVLLPICGERGWPAAMAPAALQGIAGELSTAIEPTTEADPAAVLIQFLVGFGNLVGRGAWMRVDGHDQHANLFAVVVGETSRSRKGTSWRRVREPLAACDPGWGAERLLSGLSSGEGLIWAVRDATPAGVDRAGPPAPGDGGVADKRVLVMESEFGGSLRVLGREGNTLSAVMRLAYDGETLRSLTKNAPAAATSPHVSICGHITREELDKHLSSVEAFNGLGNRFLWVCARRSKLLPFGGEADPRVMSSLAQYLAGVVDDAREAGAMRWAGSGARLWEAVYDDLTAAQPGVLGALTSRSEAHTLRLAMIYALLDRSREIAAEHVEAALAVWRYCSDSAAFLFGRPTADDHANTALVALRRSPEGLKKSEIVRDVFNHRITGQAVARVMDALAERGLVRCETVTTGGRPAALYVAV